MSELIKTEVCIVGAGPAGATASLFLSAAKIPHVILDKHKFPRDKICGDALSGKVLSVLKRLGPEMEKDFRAVSNMVPSYGVTFTAPNGKNLRIPFKAGNVGDTKPPGYICSRWVFDNFLAEKVRASDFSRFLENTPVNEIMRSETGFRVVSDSVTIDTKLLIVANGAQSQFARREGGIQQEDHHFSAGLRQYYKGVTGLDKENFIELHFLKNLLPGYLWIFPMANGLVNVGLGVRSDYVSKMKLNLKKVLADIIANHPDISPRFKNATVQETVKGFGLPLGSKVRTISGDSFILAGDAASLIDPFTGEGISNSMWSGMYAALQAEKCLAENDFSAGFMKQYDESVYKRLGPELKLSTTMQKMIAFPWLVNFVFNKATKNKELNEAFRYMFDDLELRKKLKSPGFYFRLLK